MVLCQPTIQITRTTSFRRARRASGAKPPLYHCCVSKETGFVSTTAASDEKPNASGLTPDQTRALPERTVDPNGPDARIVRSLRELYSCKAQNVRLCVLPPSTPSTDQVWVPPCRDRMKFILETLSFTALLASPAG